MWSFGADWEIVLIVLQLYHFSTAYCGLYAVTAPKTYVALSGDIETNYEVPIDAPILRIQLTDITNIKERHLVKKEVPKTATTGKLIFPCGIVDRAGKIEFRLVTAQGEKILARSEVTDVKWPPVEVHVPLLVETYSSDFIVELLARMKCHPREEENYKIYLELIYLGPSLPSASQRTSWYYSGVLLTRVLSPLFSQKMIEISLDCDVFDRAGYHKIRLRTEENEQIAESEAIHVLWSHRYSINVPQSTLDPCNHGVTVVYRYPRCTLDKDRIRVYGKKKQGRQDNEYLFERKIRKGKHSTTLTCDLFHQEYNTFCFVYVSEANNGAVFELVRQCLSRNIDPGGISPEWSVWSEWSTCSTTCATGVRIRYRLCNIPASSGNCDGRPVESEICNNTDCTELTTFISEESPLVSTRCWCGCVINVTEDGILSGHVTPCEYPVVWHLHVIPARTILVEFRELNIMNRRRWIVVRDSKLDIGPVLSIIKQDQPLPSPLRSTGNALRIELYSAENVTMEERGVWFRIAFESADAIQSLAVIDPSIVSKSKLSAVHVIFVILAILLGTTTAFLLVYYHFRCLRPFKTATSVRSGSLYSLHHHHHQLEEETCLNSHLLGANTSVSEISASPLPVRHDDSEESQSPEDYLHNCFIFRGASASSLTPVPESIVQSPFIAKRSVPIASVSPQLQPKKSALRQSDIKNGINQKHTTVVSPKIRRDKLLGKGSRTIQRESVAPLTESLSEFSITGSEDGFEYDYYDYGCHDVPGSFFCTDPMLMDWPPFIPIPPQQMDDPDLPLQLFASSPNESQDIQSTKS